MTIDIVLVVIFMAANCVIGFMSGKQMKTVDHFSVGHRNFTTFAIFATLSASFIGGGYTIGNAAKVYHLGMMTAFALLGFSLKEIIVALWIAPKMDAHRDCLSIGDIMAKCYGRYAKILTGVFSLIVCAGILGAQVGGMGAIFNRFFGIAPFWGILIGFGVIIFYASLGGMRAVVYTDILQFLVLIVGIPATFFFGLHKIGGWQAIQQSVPATHLHFLNSGSDWLQFLALFVTFIFGETLVPPYVQRLFMAKSSVHTRNGTFWSGVLSIPFFLLVGAIGLIAYVLDPHLGGNDALPFVVQTVLPPVVKGFVIAGIIAVIMSSAAGFLNAAAVAFVNDIVRPICSEEIADDKLLWLAKLGTLLVGIGSIVFAMMINNVMDILLYAYNFWSPIILVPLVAAIFQQRVDQRNFFVGASCGAIALILWTYVWHEPWQVSGVVVGVAANFIGFKLSTLWRSSVSVDEVIPA